jgi:hypothetical protein
MNANTEKKKPAPRELGAGKGQAAEWRRWPLGRGSCRQLSPGGAEHLLDTNRTTRQALGLLGAVEGESMPEPVAHGHLGNPEGSRKGSPGLVHLQKSVGWCHGYNDKYKGSFA